MEENNNQADQEKIKEDALGLLGRIREFLADLVNIKEDTDKDQTIEDIKKDIPFRGHTVWILICSIFIASFGLNANSVAVVIGAMLISPLMGPILGMGMALALNDIDTLKRSLVNFGVMVGVSILTASFFFWIFPLKIDSSELLARTAPDIRDVFIAFFGGLALVIAKSKKGTIAGVIFGVAIATALMPPLCTAGYGIATGKLLSFTSGAMYLFLINTVFIALATFLVLKLLRFPMVKYANSTKRKRIARLAYVVAILFMIPAIKTFITVLDQSKFETDYKNYIANEIKSNPKLHLLDYDSDFDNRTISLEFYNSVAEETKADLLNELNNYKGLKNVKLEIREGDTKSFELVNSVLEEKIDEVKIQRKKISDLEQTIVTLEKQIELSSGQKTIDFLAVSKDAKIKFSSLSKLSFSNELVSDFVKLDTIPVVRTEWSPTVVDSIVPLKNNELKTWLKDYMKLDKVEVKSND